MKGEGEGEGEGLRATPADLLAPAAPPPRATAKRASAAGGKGEGRLETAGHSAVRRRLDSDSCAIPSVVALVEPLEEARFEQVGPHKQEKTAPCQNAPSGELTHPLIGHGSCPPRGDLLFAVSPASPRAWSRAASTGRARVIALHRLQSRRRGHCPRVPEGRHAARAGHQVVDARASPKLALRQCASTDSHDRQPAVTSANSRSAAAIGRRRRDLIQVLPVRLYRWHCAGYHPASTVIVCLPIRYSLHRHMRPERRAVSEKGLPRTSPMPVTFPSPSLTLHPSPSSLKPPAQASSLKPPA